MKTKDRLGSVLGMFVCALGMSLFTPAWAQSVKPLKMILSVPPGAALDASARLLSEKLRVSLDRPVQIDYKVAGIGPSGVGVLLAAEHERDGDGARHHSPLRPARLVHDCELHRGGPRAVGVGGCRSRRRFGRR